MIADAPAPVVWLSSQPPDPAEAESLSRWARANSVTIAPPRDERPPTLATDATDLGASGAIEDLLEHARDAVAARDAEAVDRAIASAESLLRVHAELPQAAWLMAEVERARSTRWRRVPPLDPEAADRAWLRAEALDGGRVAGIGEVETSSRPIEAAISLDLPAGDEASLDGHPVSTVPDEGAARPVVTVAGLHALVVTTDGATVWAGWLEVGPGSSSITIDAPATVPCSVADLSRARLARDAASAPQVRCPAWIAVAPGPERGTIRIAGCEAGRCSPLVAWREVPQWSRTAPGAVEAHPRPWPAWAPWALAGACVTLATIIVGVAAGALEPAPTATRFVTGGLKGQ